VSLLTVVQSVAADVGIAIPTVVASSTDRTCQEMLAFATIVGRDIARRVDWGVLTVTDTLTGTGVDAALDLPADYNRLIDGVAISNASGAAVRPLTRAEWTMTATQGVPRYFLLTGTSIRFYPYLAAAATATVRYQSANWCDNGSDAFAADTDGTVFPEIVLEKGLNAYWRRQKGMPYQDQDAEFEATILQVAGFDDRSRL
jgi:hypothetical protein